MADARGSRQAFAAGPDARAGVSPPRAARPERELKFLLDPDALPILLRHPALQTPERTQRIRSIYFDTPEQDLRHAGMALRLRETNGTWVQTLKAETAAWERLEWDAPIDGAAVDAGALGQTPADRVLCGKEESLAPVFATSIERRVRRCPFDGGTIEVAIDAGEITSGGRRLALLEVELELLEGDLPALFNVARRLARDCPLRLSLQSKAERGYALAAGEHRLPRPAIEPKLDRDLLVGQAFQRIAGECLAQAAANAELFLARVQPETLHQLRVGLRRLRTAIRAFRGATRDSVRPRVLAGLRWLSEELDLARELDVLTAGPVAEAQRLEPGNPAIGSLVDRFALAREAAQLEAAAAIRSSRYGLLLVDVAGWIACGPWLRSTEPACARRRDQGVATFAAKAIDRQRRAFIGRGGRRFWSTPEARHRTRILGKRLRYLAEFFDPLSVGREKRRRRFLALARTAQGCLGELNDIAVCRVYSQQEAPSMSPAEAFELGRIVGRMQEREPALLKEARRAVRALASGKFKIIPSIPV